MAESYDGDIKLSVSLKPGDIKTSAQRLSKSVSEIFNANAGKELDKSLNRVLNTMDKVNTRSNNIIARMHELENTKTPTKEYENLGKNIDKISNQMDHVNSQMREFEKNNNTWSPKYVELKKQLQELEAEQDRYLEKYFALEESGGAFIQGTETAEYAKLTDQLSQLNNQQRMNVASWDLMTTEEEEVVSSTSSVSQAFTGVQSNLKAVTGVMGSVVLSFKKLASVAAGKLKNALRSLVSHFKSLSKHSSAAGLSIGGMFKKLIKYGLGMTSLVMLFNKLRGAVTEGINNLVQFNDGANETNRSMSMLTSSLTAFKNSIGAAAAPLLNALAPALTRIIDLATQAANSIGKLIASLTGKSTFVQAVKVEQDYAKSLDKTAKNTKKAKKESDGYLSSIDEINKFQSKKDSDSDDGGAGGAGAGAGFKEVPIESSIKNLADMIKDAWAKADFTELGKMVGDKLAEALANIDWGKIQETARKIAKSLATFINGFIQGEFDGISLGTWIGSTIAEALNTGIQFVNTFLTTVHWSEVGDFFGDIVNGWIDKFDFEGFFMQFTNALNALADFLVNFAGRVKWEEFGTKVANGINNALSKLEAGKLAQGISSLIKGMMTSIVTTIEKTDWKQVGEKLVEFITNVDWKGIIDEASEGLDALVQAILDFLSGVFGENDPGVISTLSTAIDTLKISIENLKKPAQDLYDNVIKPIGDFAWDVLHEHLTSINDLLTKFNEYLQGNTTFDEFFDSLSIGQEMVVLFGIALKALATVFGVLLIAVGAVLTVAAAVQAIIPALLAGIVAGILYLRKHLDEIKEKIKEGWENLKAKFNELVQKIGQKFQDFINKIKTALNNFKQFWSNVWNSVKTTIINIFTTIWNKIRSIMNSILGGVEKMVNGVINGFNKMIGAVNNLDFDVPDWVPVVGGKSFGLNIPTMSTVSLPRLAQGAVIPPNKEFAAVLGDQKQGMNIETPLETMKQAFKEALLENGNGNTKQMIQFILPNKQLIAEYVIEGGRILQSSRGSNPFELA